LLPSSAAWNDPEAFPAVNAVRLEIIVIHREHRIQTLTSRQMDKRGVGKVHGSIRVTFHQRLEFRKVEIIDGQYRYRARTQKSPSRSKFTTIPPKEMEQLRQNGG
jgi:hypothetical protein